MPAFRASTSARYSRWPASASASPCRSAARSAGGSARQAGNAEPFPSTLREAVDLWEGSEFARAAFGEHVWAHYLNYGRTEQRLFDQVVTDYERRRMFERG